MTKPIPPKDGGPSPEQREVRRVLVVDSQRTPLAPCTSARARILLREQKAAVLRYVPFTLILKHEVDAAATPTCHIGIDPGTQHAGFALVLHRAKRGPLVVWHAELKLRQKAIRMIVEKRAAVRRARRNRLWRRPARFNNRTRAKGWLPPSLEHVIARTTTVVSRLVRWCRVGEVRIERVEFDTQALLRDVTQGRYGTLAHRVHLKEYLYAVHRGCAYCRGASKDTRYELEHVLARALGGSHSVVNHTLACHTCNQSKGKLTIPQWVAWAQTGSTAWHQAIVTHAPAIWERCMRLTDQADKGRWVSIAQGLADAANMNRLRQALFDRIVRRHPLLVTIFHPAWVTHYRRILSSMPKDHWVDAALVGQINDRLPILGVRGPALLLETPRHQSRQMIQMDAYGFPKTNVKGPSRRQGVCTGDICRFQYKHRKFISRVALSKNRAKFFFDGKFRSISLEEVKVIQRA